MAGPTTLARPYAQASFEVAHERGTLDAWEKALKIAAVLAGHADVRRVIGHPRVEQAAAIALLNPEGERPDGFDEFMQILAENGRLPLLPSIAEQFSVLKDEAERTVAVSVSAAVEVDEDYRHRLERALATRFGRNIELTVDHNPELLGGAVIQAGDLVIDGSVRGKLARMNAALAP